jgi:Putative peptidoglycan binding domain
MKMPPMSGVSLAFVAAAITGCASMHHQTPTSQSTAPTPSLTSMVSANSPDAGDQVPPNARPGECYAKVVVAPTYKTEEQQLLRRAAGEKVEIVPAKYEVVDERVILKPASKRLEIIPATYDTVDERVMVRPAGKKIEQVPATYETVSEQILVSPATTAWKRGSANGSTATKVDDATGEVLCLVEVPAVYKTVSKEVVKTPATSREIEIPAEFTTVKKQVLKTPASTREIDVPAEFGTVKVTKLVTPSKEIKTAIPAEYQAVQRTVQTSAGRSEWRQILCETNSTSAKLTEIQQALKTAGFDPGRTDGVMSTQSFGAIQAYQQAKSLPVDSGRYINVATVKALGLAAK